MRLKLKFLSLLFLVLFLGFSAPKDAYADTVTLTGKISDSSGTEISNASVTVSDSATSTNVANTTTNSIGDYSTIFNQGTYNIQITPPTGSGY